MPVIRAIRDYLESEGLTEIQISIDTMNSQTAKVAVSAGANIINDVSGGLADDQMFAVAAATGVTIAIGHWRGFSDSMDSLNEYQDIARDVAVRHGGRLVLANRPGGGLTARVELPDQPPQSFSSAEGGFRPIASGNPATGG